MYFFSWGVQAFQMSGMLSEGADLQESNTVCREQLGYLGSVLWGGSSE